VASPQSNQEAAAYLWLGALGSLEAAILYFVDSIATRRASGLILQSYWQMMGAREADDRVLLFGISTAFIFRVVQFYYQPCAPRAGRWCYQGLTFIVDTGRIHCRSEFATELKLMLLL
jgi:hypothetical protein